MDAPGDRHDDNIPLSVLIDSRARDVRRVRAEAGSSDLPTPSVNGDAHVRPVALLFAAIVVLAVSACGDDSTDTPLPTPTAPASAALKAPDPTPTMTPVAAVAPGQLSTSIATPVPTSTHTPTPTPVPTDTPTSSPTATETRQEPNYLR